MSLWGPPAVAHSTSRRQPVIVVVDDDRDTRELYRASFDTVGYRTAEAETGGEAIAIAHRLLPDLVLTDYLLPDIDGLTVAARLREQARTAAIRVILVTGYGGDDLSRRASNAGIARALLKPCLPDVMPKEVRRLLGRRATARFGHA